MNGSKRTYSYLKKHMSLTEFENFCKRIASLYAKSENQFSSSYFVENDNITKSCFYKVLEEAVVRNLVSDEVVNMMEKKAIFNQNANAKSAGATTLNHYARLRKKREKFIMSIFTDDKIKELAEYFAQNPEDSKKDIAIKYGITNRKLDEFLQYAFINNIADDETCKLIEVRSLAKNSDDRAKQFFTQLWEKRISNKEDTLN